MKSPCPVTGSFNSRRYADKRERGPGLGGAAATGGCDIGFAGEAQQADREIAQGGHRLRDAATAHLGTILIVSHVAHPVRLVFDGPVLADQTEQTGGIGTLGRQASACLPARQLP